MTEDEVFHLIKLRLRHARQKHHVFAANAIEGFHVIRGEVEELEHAVLYESFARQIDELADVVATCVRQMMREYE